MTEEDDELDEEYISKVLGQFQLALNGVLFPLRKYGQEDYVIMINHEIVGLLWQTHQRLNGIDTPLELSPHMRFMLEIK